MLKHVFVALLYVSLLEITYSIRTIDSSANAIFERFLRNLFTTISTNDFPEKRLTTYCKILQKALGNMEYKHTKKMAKYLKGLLKYGDCDLNTEFASYLEELNKPLKYRREFLDAMNSVMTYREDLFFNDYIHDLIDYCNEDKLDIAKETSKILWAIEERVLERYVKERRDIEVKMKKAIKEYDSKSWDWDWLLDPGFLKE